MNLEVLGAHETAEGLAVVFATERGVQRLEGSPDEIARLARAMRQVAALGQRGEHERAWLDEVQVGRSVVKLGIGPGGMARVLILHDAASIDWLDLEA
jgi:hypothetical protein